MGFAAGSILGVGSGIKIVKKAKSDLSKSFLNLFNSSSTVSKGSVKNNFNISKPKQTTYSKYQSTQAQNANAQIALYKKLRALQGAKKDAVKIAQLPDGRVRYYDAERLARNPGPTRGSSFVTEYNPKTGQVRQWSECYDQFGSINRVHPKTIDGQDLRAQHYPPTKKEINSWLKNTPGGSK